VTLAAMRNLITDVAGLRVGQAEDPRIASGTTVILFDEPAVTAVDVRGGGPGTRDTELLAPEMTVEAVQAICISGGSAFGLDATTGVQAWLAEQGRGFAVGDALVPIVPSAILFDLLNGGDKKWGRFSPYRELGYRAAASCAQDFALGNAGAGYGATVANLKGGLGSASGTVQGFTIGAIAAVNAVGAVTVGDTGHFWAAPYEQGDEFGGRGLPSPFPANALAPRIKGGPPQSTTPAMIVTDAALTKAQCKRLAIMAQTGMARAIYPVHTPLDGDIVFAAATGAKPLKDPLADLTAIGIAAANVLARAIARGVYEATALPFDGALPDWKNKFGG
jgi:D-aminopeptidase